MGPEAETSDHSGSEWESRWVAGHVWVVVGSVVGVLVECEPCSVIGVEAWHPGFGGMGTTEAQPGSSYQSQ